MPSALNMPTYGAPGYTPGATFILPGSAYSMRSGERSKAQYGDVVEANVKKETYVADELNGIGDASMFSLGDDSRFRGQVDRYTEGLGAEDFGPPAPTGTQLAVQEVRDIVTSDVKIPSSFSTSTIIYALGGVALAYLAYQYMYSEA
jgi:hypothetical protein